MGWSFVIMKKVDSFTGIVRKRSLPGTLIFDMNNRLLYFNKEAEEMIPDLPVLSRRQNRISKEISNIYNELKKIKKARGFDWKANFKSRVLKNKSGLPYLIRAFFIGGNKKKSPGHIMVLIEKIIKKHAIDFEKARREFKLSEREVEVMRLICRGLANKEISKKLFITEYTVKDHLKNILRKIGVTSRSQIITTLK
jgi:DNA-binding CsgD family transcriptional regulator